jgi:hypothetical protein
VSGRSLKNLENSWSCRGRQYIIVLSLLRSLKNPKNILEISDLNMVKHLQNYMEHCSKAGKTPTFSLDGSYPSRKDSTVCVLDVITRIDEEKPKVVYTNLYW